jgi:hypothetical protein
VLYYCIKNKTISQSEQLHKYGEIVRDIIAFIFKTWYNEEKLAE